MISLGLREEGDVPVENSAAARLHTPYRLGLEPRCSPSFWRVLRGRNPRHRSLLYRRMFSSVCLLKNVRDAGITSIKAATPTLRLLSTASTRPDEYFLLWSGHVGAAVLLHNVWQAITYGINFLRTTASMM